MVRVVVKAENPRLTFSQVHAEASTFASGLSKKEVYAQVYEQAEALFADQRIGSGRF